MVKQAHPVLLLEPHKESPLCGGHPDHCSECLFRQDGAITRHVKGKGVRRLIFDACKDADQDHDHEP